MSFRFQRKESVAEGVRRVAAEEAGRAIDEAAGDGPVARRVHAARTRCKRLRGLLRLVRPQLGETADREIRLLRDAAGRLSASRDAFTIRAAFDDLARRGDLDPAAADAARAALGQPAAADDDGRIEAFAEVMRAFRDRVDDWRLPGHGFAAIAEGLASTYRRGRRAMDAAIATGDDGDRHEWRKRAKDHWYHVRLLRDVWEPVMTARHRELERLADLLGDDHDLAVLADALRGADLDPAHAIAVANLIDRRRVKRFAAVEPLGRRLYAERPRDFTRRVLRYWRVWRKG